jgi:hypothetical protein
LLALIASSFPNCKVIELDAPLEPPCDLQVPMMSLPFACGTRLENIPGNVPYLASIAGRSIDGASAWGSRARLRVGIACSGNPGPRMSHRVRRIPLEKFSRLSAFADVFLIQKEIGATDAEWLQANRDSIRSFADDLAGFDDTAALVECMDLIVSADTSLVHLAGGLAKPTWVLLPWESEWRWLLDREDSRGTRPQDCSARVDTKAGMRCSRASNTSSPIGGPENPLQCNASSSDFVHSCHCAECTSIGDGRAGASALAGPSPFRSDIRVVTHD